MVFFFLFSIATGVPSTAFNVFLKPISFLEMVNSAEPITFSIRNSSPENAKNLSRINRWVNVFFTNSSPKILNSVSFVSTDNSGGWKALINPIMGFIMGFIIGFIIGFIPLCWAILKFIFCDGVNNKYQPPFLSFLTALFEQQLIILLSCIGHITHNN